MKYFGGGVGGRRFACRTPHGVRGLKYGIIAQFGLVHRRTPHGVRGLKLGRPGWRRIEDESHPTRGAWIEIVVKLYQERGRDKSHPTRGAWIEIHKSKPRSAIL